MIPQGYVGAPPTGQLWAHFLLGARKAANDYATVYQHALSPVIMPDLVRYTFRGYLGEGSGGYRCSFSAAVHPKVDLFSTFPGALLTA